MTENSLSEEQPPASPSHDLRRRTFSALGGTTAVLIADRLLQIAILAILARLLSPAQTAVAAAGALIVGALGLINSFGAQPGLIQTRNFESSARAEVRGAMFATVLMLVAIAELLAPGAGRWFHDDEVTWAVRLTALGLLTQPFGIVATVNLTRRLRSLDVACADLGATTASGFVSIPMALAGAGWQAIAAGAVAAMAVRALILCLRDGDRPNMSFRLAATGWFYGEHSKFLVSGLCIRAEHDLPRWIVGHFMPTADLGLFTRATGLMAYPSSLFGLAADRVMLAPVAMVQDDRPRLRQAVLDALQLTALVGMPLAAGLFILAPDLIGGILGPAWTLASGPFKIIAVAVYLRLAERLNWLVLRGGGQASRLAGIQLAGIAVLAVGCSLASRWSLNWVCAAITAGATLTYAATSLAAMARAGIGPVAWLAAHRHGLAAAGLAILVLAPVSWTLHAAGTGPLAVLVIAALASAGIGGLALRLAPGIFLGSAGVQMARQIFKRRLGPLRSPKAGSHARRE